MHFFKDWQKIIKTCFKMYFNVNLVIWNDKIHFLKVYCSKNSNESERSSSSLKWPFILLILYYLQVSFYILLKSEVQLENVAMSYII